MKKCLLLILGIILTASLAACGNSSRDSADDKNEEVISSQEVSDTEEQETQEKLRIYWQKKLTPIFLKSFRRRCILRMI